MPVHRTQILALGELVRDIFFDPRTPCQAKILSAILRDGAGVECQRNSFLLQDRRALQRIGNLAMVNGADGRLRAPSQPCIDTPSSKTMETFLNPLTLRGSSMKGH